MFQCYAFSFTNYPLLCRGRILVQAREKEDIVYADIGEWDTIVEHVMAVTPDASTRLRKGNWIHSSLILFFY